MLVFEGCDIVADRDEDEEAWRASRREMVTASESAHLLGIYRGKPWGMSPDELAARKKNPPPDRVGPLAHAGRFWESRIMDWFAHVTGLVAIGTSALYRSSSLPFMGATPDGVLVHRAGGHDPNTIPFLRLYDGLDEYEGESAVRELEALVDRCDGEGKPLLVEAKNQESRRRSRWNKLGSPPPEYVCQARHQSVVLGAGACVLLAKVDANELYAHIVDRDPAYEDLLVGACEDFAKKYF